MTELPRDAKPRIAAAVIVHDRRVLLVRRRQAEGSLLWAFPSGAVEPNESVEEAAARETREEVGLIVTPVKNLGERLHPATGRQMTYIACDADNNNAYVADTDELAELAWSSHHQLRDYVPHGFFPPVEDYLDAQIGEHPA